MQLDRFYDALNTAVFLPWGGSRRIRRALVDSLEVSSRDRVVELGCGTGQVTELLVATGAEVVAVDQLPAMLVGAQRRAPQARIIEGDAMSAEVGGDFDRVVLAFVLHNFDGGGRVDLLRRSRSLLAEEGWVGVLEWGLPNGRWRVGRVAVVPAPARAVPERRRDPGRSVDGRHRRSRPAGRERATRRRRAGAGARAGTRLTAGLGPPTAAVG